MAAAPAASTAQKQIFLDLAARFEFKVEIVEEILKAGVRSLSDFRYYPADNAELVQAFVVPCKFDDERLQGARLKSAWNSVVRAEKASEVPGADIQLDEEELLPSNQLNSLKELHYSRYHLRFAPEVAPGDRLITKLSRALTKNSLEVYQIPQVKNLMAQRHDPPKRRKIAQNLWLTGEEEEPTQTDSAGYMERLWTYLIALSIAGIEKTLTPPATPESLSTNSADYVIKGLRNFAKVCLSPIASMSLSTLTGPRERSGPNGLPIREIPLAASSFKSTKKEMHIGLHHHLWQLHRLQCGHLPWHLWHLHNLHVQHRQEVRWPRLCEMGSHCVRTGRMADALSNRRDLAQMESISVHICLSPVEFVAILDI